MAPQGISVHVGVNEPLPKFGMTPLTGCVPDAISMQKLATLAKFETKLFLDKDATFEKVTGAVLEAAGRLKDGDIFLFTFAGHGSFKSTLKPGDDGRDETILLRDCLLIDNFVRRNLWSQFVTGVRILGIADSCHSGTVLLALDTISADGPPVANAVTIIPDAPAFEAPLTGGSSESGSGTETAPPKPPPPPANGRKRRIRGFTDADRERIVANTDPVLHKKMEELLSGEQAKLKGSLITLAACRDNEEALDGPDHGAFTKALLEVWNEGAFDGDYDLFIKNIQAKFSPLQQFPNKEVDQVDDKFLKQRPFTI